jgi:rod shape-determining protein MreC
MARAMEHHQTPVFFVRGPSAFTRLFFFAVLSLAMMTIDSRLHYLTEVRQGFVALLQPLEVVASAPVKFYLSTREYLTSHHELFKENRKLKRQALVHGVALQRLQALEVENSHLRSLLGASSTLKPTARLAEILHMGRDPFSHKVVINLGSRQNIVPGQAVVDADGVIGQITRVYPFSSEVTLITDKELSIPVQVERNGLRAIAFGQGQDNRIDLPYLPPNVDVREGDMLLTSGIDGVYPAGLAVAKVTRIERNPDSPFAHIVCAPVAGIENHKQVLVLSLPPINAADIPADGDPELADPANPNSVAPAANVTP